jgi:hypothetical protein
MASEITVDFDAATQSLDALNAAAYRLIGIAARQVEASGSHYVCRLTPTGQLEPDTLRTRFLELVTDENVREGLRAKTRTCSQSHSLAGIWLTGCEIPVTRP